jgi:hypothetical protein
LKPLIAAEATTFVLIQKVAKNQVIRNASLPHKAFALQIRQNLGWNLFAATLPRRPIHCKNFLCPAIAHKATIVLPDFARSCSTDEKGKAHSKRNTLNEP